MLVPLNVWFRAIADLRHWATQRDHTTTRGTPTGQTIWMALSGTSPMALCWDWAEVQKRVLVLADPLAVRSNVRFVLPDGTGVDRGSEVIALNHAIHSLSWQRETLRALNIQTQAGVSLSHRGVQRSTSSSAVKPCATLVSPATRNGSMPSETARRLRRGPSS